MFVVSCLFLFLCVNVCRGVLLLVYCLFCCECLFVVGVAVVAMTCLFDSCSALSWDGLLDFVIDVLGLLYWVCWFAVWCVLLIGLLLIGLFFAFAGLPFLLLITWI